jgi:CRP-like cAMP-binding protein
MNPQAEKELVDSVKEILKWIKIQAQPTAKSILEAALPDSSQRKIYQALDGKLTQKQLAESSRTSQPTISRLINSWQHAGIVEEVSPGRYSRTFDLNSLGIDLTVPEAKD